MPAKARKLFVFKVSKGLLDFSCVRCISNFWPPQWEENTFLLLNPLWEAVTVAILTGSQSVFFT